MTKATTRLLASLSSSTPSTSTLPAKKLVARTRPLPARKALLHSTYSHLLRTSSLLLFLRPGDLTAQEWSTLRSSLPPTSASSLTPSTPKLTILRTGILPALLRDPSGAFEGLDSSLLYDHQKGPLALLSAPDLHPPTLQTILSLLKKTSLAPSHNLPPPDPKAGAGDKKERLEVLSAILEKRAFGKEGTEKIGKLPGLDMLRSQVVGLLSMQGQRIVGVLGARGREVGRTVEGFKEGLREKEEATTTAA